MPTAAAGRPASRVHAVAVVRADGAGTGLADRGRFHPVVLAACRQRELDGQSAAVAPQGRVHRGDNARPRDTHAQETHRPGKSPGTNAHHRILSQTTRPGEPVQPQRGAGHVLRPPRQTGRCSFDQRQPATESSTSAVSTRCRRRVDQVPHSALSLSRRRADGLSASKTF